MSLPPSWAAWITLIQKGAPHLLGLLTLLSAALAVTHAVLTKEDERAAAGWVGIICLVPGLGPLLYLLLGINRIRRRAVALSVRRQVAAGLPTEDAADETSVASHLHGLRRLVGHVVQQPLVGNNHIKPLQNGEAAYPAMIQAIDAAQRSVLLCTYIFDHDQAGSLFSDALTRAHQRGVSVRVLIDAVGARYSWPSMVRHLRRQGITVALFGQTKWPWRMPYANLRNHRKLLLCDGTVGFAGGMNIRVGHLAASGTPDPIVDLHFRITGPILRSMWDTFNQDWYSTTGESLTEPTWQPSPAAGATVVARRVLDGPDADLNKLHWVLMGALACAEHSVYIVTPYFLPDQALIAALNTAAMRGVQVHILLPAHNNLRLVHWASTAMLPQLLAAGCAVYRIGTVFDHTKLMLVDDEWSLIGSANWDPRSLRLNFEFNIECYSRPLAAQLRALVDSKLQGAQRLHSADILARPMVWQLRDNVVRLTAPYL